VKKEKALGAQFTYSAEEEAEAALGAEAVGGSAAQRRAARPASVGTEHNPAAPTKRGEFCSHALCPPSFSLARNKQRHEGGGGASILIMVLISLSLFTQDTKIM
jgi:hypothetical protein